MKQYTHEEARKIMQKQKAKDELAKLDHQTLKYIDGDITAEEYAPYKKRRAELRELIRKNGG